MIRRRFSEEFGVEHPVVQGGARSARGGVAGSIEFRDLPRTAAGKLSRTAAFLPRRPAEFTDR